MKKKSSVLIIFMQKVSISVLNWLSKHYKLLLICLVPALLVLFTAFFYANKFGFSFQENTPDNTNLTSLYGSFGDYFGGILNPLLAFINIFLIVYFQQIDNRKTSEINNIFKMIELQNNLRNSIIINDYEDKYEGLEVFTFLDKEIIDAYINQNNGPDLLKNLASAYVYIFDEKFRKQYLSHYFMNLYQLYKMITESSCLSKTEKFKYAKIARAQLSHLELKFLFFNCISYPGKKFEQYVGRYNLLEWFDDTEFSNLDAAFAKSKVVKNRLKSWNKKYG